MLLPVVTVMLSRSDMVINGLQFFISGLAQLVASVSMSNLLKRIRGTETTEEEDINNDFWSVY